jgi:hypothetical protein
MLKGSATVWARVMAAMEIPQDVRSIRCSTLTERASERGFSKPRHSGTAQSRAMPINLYKFNYLASRGAPQAVLVRQPEKL